MKRTVANHYTYGLGNGLQSFEGMLISYRHALKTARDLSDSRVFGIILLFYRNTDKTQLFEAL